ncbi:MAG: HemK2/MTQ2 family protein methyltransferase [Candidatus Aenigmatarchaeota archaeon]
MPKFFYKDIELEVPEGVYEPREDTILLADLLVKEKPGKALEIGCGSGLLSIILARNGSDVTAIDIEPRAVEATKRNAEKSGLKVNAFVSDLFEKVEGKFDLIVFNPPYLRDEISKESRAWAAGKGLEVVREFVSNAREHLEERGKVWVVISSLTGKEEVEGLLRKQGFEVRVIAQKKVPWETLFVLEAR